MSNQSNGIGNTEKCVLCGEFTGVLISTPTECRENYVDGCGQLCEKCAIKIAEEQNIF